MTYKQGVVFLLVIICLTACNPQQLSIEEQPTAASCEPNEPCEYNNKARIWLPDPSLTPETAFDINLSLPKNIKIQNAKLEGVTMYMGYIPVSFEVVDTIYQAHTMVGVCSEKNMKWKLLVQVQDSQGQIQHLTYYFFVRY